MSALFKLRKIKSTIIGALAVLCSMLFTSDFYAAEKNAIYYNKKGWEYLEKGDSFRAILNFKNALKQNPKYRESLSGLGRAYLSTSAYDESFKLFNEVLKVDKDNKDAKTGMGFAMVGIGRYNDALAYFDRVDSSSENNLEAKYGMAYVYYLMDKRIWAKRKLEGILRVNPYHYDSLLLMAEMKSDDGRLDDAKKFIDKAIESNRELPEGYVRSGKILFKYYIKNENDNFLEESVDEFNRSLAINPENFEANRYMGFISIIQKRYDAALRYFEKITVSFPDNGIAQYNLALAYERKGDLDEALPILKKSLDIASSDELVQAKLEDFLVMNSYKIGHPLRVGYSNNRLAKAVKKSKEHLSDDAVLNLRRSLYLNPVNKEPRGMLRDFYHTFDYYLFYVDEIKNLLNMYPDEGYQDALNIALVRRREKLYYKTGFAEELPPRDVPGIFVFNLWNNGDIAAHPDAGEILSGYLTFTLAQFGRQDAVRLKHRLDIMKQMKDGENFLTDNLEKLGDMSRRGDIKGLRYVVFGSYREANTFLSANFRIMDFKTGVIIDEFDISESQKDNLSRLSLRAARRIFSSIPYEGRVLKIEEDRIILNLGLFDGVKPGDLLAIYRYDRGSAQGRINMRKKLVFVVDDADTIMASAKPQTLSELEMIDVNDPIYPLTKRRAKLLK